MGEAAPFFLDVGTREAARRFCMHHPPRGERPRALVVHVPAMAEEANKSRRMAAWQSRALADAGYAVLRIDPFGCGDSEGDLSEASWEVWRADIAAAVQWLRRRHGDAPVWLWGQRSGALLALDAMETVAAPCHLLLWQPVIDGAQWLQQFLRLRIAADLVGAAAKQVLQELRAALSAGGHVEVGGYRLPAAVARGLEAARLHPPAGSGPGRIEWLDVSMREAPTRSPAVEACVAAWGAAGWRVRHHMVPGPSFWQTVEIEDAPELVAATLGAVEPEAAPIGCDAAAGLSAA